MTVIPAGVGVGTYAASNSTLVFSGNGTSAQLEGITGDSIVFSGNVASNLGEIYLAQNAGTGTITNEAGSQTEAVNLSTGTVTTAVGNYSVAQNSSTGPITTGIGVQGLVNNVSTGTVTTAYGGEFYISNPSGTVITGAGVFIGGIQATNKWSIYSVDSTAPSAFAGNIGIGTITPIASLSVVGNIGIGTGSNSVYVTTSPPAGGMIIQGNVGIGSTTPGKLLDVQGTIRTFALTMSGQTPISGYVMTASDSAGDTTWTSSGSVSGWTVSGNNVYETGTGNVGIGSFTPGQKLDVQGTVRDIGEFVNGNVGIGTFALQTALAVTNGNVGIWHMMAPADILQVGKFASPATVVWRLTVRVTSAWGQRSHLMPPCLSWTGMWA